MTNPIYVKKYTLNLGLTLVPIPPGQKGPKHVNWQKDPKVWINKNNQETRKGWNIGVLHSQSNTCCLDIDDMSKALSALSSLGFPVEELRKEPTAYYGNPERLKVLYRLPSNIEGIPYYKGAGFEFRSGSMQDVLPPSIHPDTGEEYVWINGIPSTIPEVPSKLLEAISELEDDGFKQLDKESIPGRLSNPMYNSLEGEATLNDVRSALSVFPLEVVDDYHEWIRVGFALKNCLAKYKDKAWKIWKEWSEQSTKWDEDKARYYWNKLNPKSRTVRSIFYKAEKEFEWTNPSKGKKKAVSSVVERALQLELEEKWKGKLWFITGCKNGLSSIAWHEDFKKYVRSTKGEAESLYVVDQLLEHYERIQFEEEDEANELKCKFLSSSSNSDKLRKRLSETGELHVKQEDFDAIPELWAFEGGVVVNIKTGEVLENSPEYMILTTRPYKFDPNARGEFTRQFLETLIPNEDIRKSFISYLCATALADTRHKIFPFLYGGGNNGKSTLLRWMSKLFDSMGGVLSVRAITSNRGFIGSDNGLMVILGKRYVYIDETPDNIVLDISVVKKLTGGSESKIEEASAKFAETKTNVVFNGIPWMASNYKPTLNANDNAVWNRIKLIEFGDPIENPDRDLLEKLVEDLPGAFNLLVEWVKEYVEQNMEVYEAQEIKDAVQEYREDNDIMQDFINDMLVVGNGQEIGEYKLWTIYKSYTENRPPINRRELFKRIGKSENVKRDGHAHIFYGLGEKDNFP